MILAIVEQDQGKIEPHSLAMLTFARKFCKANKTRLDTAVIGNDAEHLSVKIHDFGAKHIYWVRDHGSFLDNYSPEASAKCLRQLVVSANKKIVLAAGTERGNELMAHLAAQMDLPMAANCSEIQSGEILEVTRQRWGGSLLEKTQIKEPIQLFTLALNLVEPEECPIDYGLMETFTPSLKEEDLRVQMTSRDESSEEGVSLKTASLVVGGGRGVGSAEGFQVLEDLAECLGGVVGGSRVATNNGWRPHTQQVGLTGNRIAPKLYIACGISGAIQHLVGCKGAKNILVINQDEEAPFFAKADYGVVGDLHEVVPALISEIQKNQP